MLHARRMFEATAKDISLKGPALGPWPGRKQALNMMASCSVPTQQALLCSSL